MCGGLLCFSGSVGTRGRHHETSPWTVLFDKIRTNDRVAERLKQDSTADAVSRLTWGQRSGRKASNEAPPWHAGASRSVMTAPDCPPCKIVHTSTSCHDEGVWDGVVFQTPEITEISLAVRTICDLRAPPCVERQLNLTITLLYWMTQR